MCLAGWARLICIIKFANKQLWQLSGFRFTTWCPSAFWVHPPVALQKFKSPTKKNGKWHVYSQQTSKSASCQALQPKKKHTDQIVEIPVQLSRISSSIDFHQRKSHHIFTSHCSNSGNFPQQQLSSLFLATSRRASRRAAHRPQSAVHMAGPFHSTWQDVVFDAHGLPTAGRKPQQ